MDADTWDQRYAASELVWSAGPNQWVMDIVTDLGPGRALDLAAGEGRNAIWLVEQGWDVTAVDFSAVAVERARELARGRLGEAAARLTALVGDATESHGDGFDLVLFSYLHLPPDQWQRALAAAVESCAPGGRVVVIGHARRNLSEGVGGPQDPDILYDPEHVLPLLDGLPVDVERADTLQREVATDDGTRLALDTVVVARRR